MPNQKPNPNLVQPPANAEAAQRALDIQAAQGGGKQGDPSRLGQGTKGQ